MSRAIPSERPTVLAELASPPWLHRVGAEPALVDGRLLLWGWIPSGPGRAPALLEMDDAGAQRELFRVDHQGVNVAASRPVAVGNGRVALAFELKDLAARAVIVDSTGRVLSSAAIDEAVHANADFVSRASGDAAVIGWSGWNGRTRAETVCIDANGERWRAGGILLGVAAGGAFFSTDGLYATEIRAIDVATGARTWVRNAPEQRRVRGAVGTGDDTLFVVEQPADGVRGDTLVAIDAATGETRWAKVFEEGRVAAMRVRGRAAALVTRDRGAVRTFLMDDRGNVLGERARSPAAFERFEVVALDHTHVLWVDPKELISERISGGETAWRIPLPDPFHERDAIRAACADGRIALRHETRVWILG